MRTPNKSRSRNKNNRRNNSGGGGNVLNRVYDSAGPDGKVRGTPQQVIEKYQALAHDSALAGDRVAMENFQQHAEHYIRLINEAQRQIAERREAQDAERQNQGGGNNRNDAGQPPRSDQPDSFDPGAGEQPAIAESDAMEPASGEADNGGLVETPETQAEAKRKPRARKPRPPRAEKSDDTTQTAAE